MEEKNSTIEQQIRNTIKEAMEVFHRENVGMIERTIDRVVNGKIDDFRKDQCEVNKRQDATLARIEKQTKDVVDFYDGSSTFFKVSVVMAKWITIVAGGAVAVWAFIKFVVNGAMIK